MTGWRGLGFVSRFLSSSRGGFGFVWKFVMSGWRELGFVWKFELSCRRGLGFVWKYELSGRLSWHSRWLLTVLPDESNARNVRLRSRNTIRDRSGAHLGATVWARSVFPVWNTRSSSLGKTGMLTLGARFLDVGLQSQLANGKHTGRSLNSKESVFFILHPLHALLPNMICKILSPVA
jgi:hypothetical protein